MAVLASTVTSTSAALPDRPSPSSTFAAKEKDLEAAVTPEPRRSCLPRWLELALSARHVAPCDVSPSDNPEVGIETATTKDPWSTLTRSLDLSPEGYSQVAAFQSSDPNFLLYRGFGHLHCRLLISMQYEVECLETQLDALDKWDKAHGEGEKLCSQRRDELQSGREKVDGTFPKHFSYTRPEILCQLRSKLLAYDAVLLKARDVSALQRPSARDYSSVHNWFRNNEPLIENEMQFVRRKEDLVTLKAGRDYARFDGLVERSLSWLDSLLIKRLRWYLIRDIFMTPELRAKCSDEAVHYYSPARIEFLVDIFITVIIFIMLVLPVIAMYELSSVGRRASPFEAMGILIIFTLLFGGTMSAMTKARRQELFAASAAYCGVLVVFISNFSTQDVVIVGS